MSLWTKFRDKAEQAGTAGLYDPVRARHNEADARYAMQQQIQAYKDQSELTKQQLDATREQETAAKRKVEETQIRALRNNYRPQTIMNSGLGSGNSGTPGMSDNLGG